MARIFYIVCALLVCGAFSATALPEHFTGANSLQQSLVLLADAARFETLYRESNV